eukprot:COSAG02_NODE_1480_length_12399_cov_250.195935_8_plen_39_part_00
MELSLTVSGTVSRNRETQFHKPSCPTWCPRQQTPTKIL